MFGNEMRTGVHILIHLIGKKDGGHVCEKRQIALQKHFPFLVSRCTMQYRKRRRSERGFMSVHCIFTI